MKDKFYSYILDLQNRITSALEDIDGKAKFKEDEWKRAEGGGGKTRVIENGNVFEKGGVNISAVHGPLPKSMQAYFKVDDVDFFACGLSLVIHPKNPFVPTVHANWRYFEMYPSTPLRTGPSAPLMVPPSDSPEPDQQSDKDTKDSETKKGVGVSTSPRTKDNSTSGNTDNSKEIIDQWFGGGLDLTPYYLFDKDAKHFHQVCKNACDKHDKAFYPKYKTQCDEYFWNNHRNEARGVGGLFFDYLKAKEGKSIEDWFNFVTEVGDSFIEAYLPIVERRKDMPYEQKHRDWQEIRRGRYVEFNLVHDKGTLFGLKTNGRIESILMSLPPHVQWQYDHHPKPNSPEEELLKILEHPKDWINS